MIALSNRAIYHSPFLPIRGRYFGVTFTYSLKSVLSLYLFSKIGTPDIKRSRHLTSTGLIINQIDDKSVMAIKNIPIYTLMMRVYINY